jgi:hypothetical protein
MGLSRCQLASAFVMAILLSASSAQAGLVGVGNTVQAFYYNGVLASPEGEIPVGASTSDPASLATPVSYQQGAADGSTIDVGHTTIKITNLLSGAPFCTTATSGTACADPIDGFDFLFTGVNILGVSVDASSAASMLPVTGVFQGNTHLGLQLLSNSEIRVDLTGDLPAVGDYLLLDLTFESVNVPEPQSLALALAGLLGLAVVRRSGRRQELDQRARQ